MKAPAVRALFALGGLGLAFAVYTAAVAGGGAQTLDASVSRAVGRLWWMPLQPLAQAIAVLGGPEVTTVLALAVAVVLWVMGFRAEAAVLALFPLLLGLEALYKVVVVHPAPLAAHSDGPSLVTMLHPRTLTLVGSYPSGHMMRSVFVYGLGAFVVRRLAPPRMVWPAVALAALVVGLVALDRVYLGVHWQSDVIGGLLLGGAALSGAIAWLDRPVRAAI